MVLGLRYDVSGCNRVLVSISYYTIVVPDTVSVCCKFFNGIFEDNRSGDKASSCSQWENLKKKCIFIFSPYSESYLNMSLLI